MLRSLVSLLAPFLALSIVAVARPRAPQDDFAVQASGGRIPVQVVAGKLVATCDVSGPRRRIPANLFLEFDTNAGLVLHNRAVAPLGVEFDDGTTRPITLHFGEFELEVERREHGDEEWFEEFTKYHSVELGETAVVGVLGAELFEDWHVVFDLAAGWVELSPPRERRTGPPQSEGEVEGDVEGAATVPITVENDLVWLPVRYGDGEPAALAVGTRRYDTTIDRAVADRQGRPAGDLAALECGGFDFTEYVALRPEEVVQVHPDGVAGVAGIGLLESFRLELDRVNRTAVLAPTRPADYPAEDLEFFRAFVDEDPDAIEAALDAHPDARLAREAAEKLLWLRVDEFAPPEVSERAVGRVLDTLPDDLRTTRAHDLMLELRNAGETALLVAAGELGIESGRDDRYPNAVHHVHGELGHALLGTGEGRRAWKHLLSAAFGLPQEGTINLDLGRYYEGEGRWRRAYSRYVQAVLSPDTGAAALEAMARIQDRVDAEEPFSVDHVERMIGGRVRSFGSATRWSPPEDENGDGDEDATGPNPLRRVTLVEFFTSPHLGNDLAGAIGGALGNEGLLAHYQDAPVAFVAYHLPDPEPTPLVNELAVTTAALLGVGRPVEHRIDGTVRAPGAARWRQAEGVFEACRGRIDEALQVSPKVDLQLTARLEDGVVFGDLLVGGLPNEDLVVQVLLVERGVLFPGKSTVVVHRRVARGSLLGEVAGVPFEPDEDIGLMELAFDRALDEISAGNERYLDELEASGAGTIARLSTRIDPKQVEVVAFVRDTTTGAVLQAARVLPIEGDDGAGEGAADR